MKLLDNSMTRKEIYTATDMLEGCVNRLCVSNDQLEIVRMVEFINDYASMIAQSRIMEMTKND